MMKTRNFLEDRFIYNLIFGYIDFLCSFLLFLYRRRLSYMRKIRKDIRSITRLVVALAIITVIIVICNTIGNMKMLTEMLQETAKLGISTIIGLIAISIACMSFQNHESRMENKNFYLNYLTLMLVTLTFLLATFLFPYLPINSNLYLYYAIFNIYFLLGIILLGGSLIATFGVIKKAFE